MNTLKRLALVSMLLGLSQAASAMLIVGKNSADNQANFEIDGNKIVITNLSTGVITGFGFHAEIDEDELDLEEVVGTLDNKAWKVLTGSNTKGYQFAVGTGKNVFGGKTQDGIKKGEKGIFELDLDDDEVLGSPHKIFVRFQNTTNREGSDKGYDCLSGDVECKKIGVPEPQTLALLVAGLIGLRACRKKA
ncbi:MAG: PEP-CTERM sorting domain-containing protein [Pseudomonadales bacterium]